MLLKDRINKASDDEILFIGASSSFFFIGTKAEYEKDIEGIQNDYIKEAERLISVNKSRLNPSDLPEKRRKAYERTIKNLTDYIKNFTPFGCRKIVGEYPRGIEKGTILVTEGKETGGYWFRSEYLEKTLPQN